MAKVLSIAPELFERGAAWVRADFHLHTIAEVDPSRTFRSSYPTENDQGAYLNDWLTKLEADQVRVGVITNHNGFDIKDYKWHAEHGRKRGILILPGVELNVNSGSGIHTLIVFSPEWVANSHGEDFIDRFLKGQFQTVPNVGTRTSSNLKDCLQALEDFKKEYFVVFAHVDSDNGLMQELAGGSLSENIHQCGDLWNRRVLGLQRVKAAQKLRGRWPGNVPVPAFVEGSDPKSILEVGTGRSCYLKVGELTFESVQFALHDHAERVKSVPPDAKLRPEIAEVRFTGGLLNGESYSVSPQLTALIGSRGSGKSSVIECLRYGLDLPSSDADTKYKNGLVSGMLSNGGEVTITGKNSHGQVVTISRPLGFPPLVKLEGKETRLRPQDVFPGVLYFGQKDLGNRHESFEAEFYAKLCGAPSAEQRNEEELCVGTVRRAVSEYRSVLRAHEKEDEYAHEEEALKVQLDLYQQRGVEDRLKALTSFDADKRTLSEFTSRLERFQTDQVSLFQEWDSLIAEFPEIRSETLDEVKWQLGKRLESLKRGREAHSNLIETLRQTQSELALLLKAVQEQEQSQQEQFAALQREINAPDLDLQKYRANRSRFEQLTKLRQAATQKGQSAQQSLANAIVAARKLHDVWRTRHRAETAALEAHRESIPSEIELKSVFEGDRPAFVSFLKSKLQGTGFKATSYEKIEKQFSNGIALFERRDEIENVLSGSTDVQKLQTAMIEHLEEFLTFRVPDRREICFNGAAIQELSLGQRATALLMLLMSLESHPIVIIDQPEDDLDNETIFRQVVEPLLKRKQTTQFIIATHNPNLPVLGDAEFVHACREVSKGKYSHTSGSLDSRDTRKNIVEIMEGGEQAFEQRQKIYRQWTNSPSAKNY